MSGVDTFRGITFQAVQALSDIVDLLRDERADAVRIEGSDDVVDYEILDRDGGRMKVRQAKTRQLTDAWSAADLAKILCTWGDLEGADQAEFAFVTDGRLGPSGHKLNDLIKAMRVDPDDAVLRAKAAKIGGKGGLTLPSLAVICRVEILSELGTVESVLAALEMRVLRMIERSRISTADDAAGAVNGLLRRLFVVAGDGEPSRRLITRAEFLAALQIDEASLAGGVTWSQAVAESYRQAVIGARYPGFLPVEVTPVASVPIVLRLMEGSERAVDDSRQPIERILDEPSAGVVGATGQGKTTSLSQLQTLAAIRGSTAVLFAAAGHVPGGLGRRIRNAIEGVLGQTLTAGAVEMVMATPDLLLLIDGVSEVDDDTRAALRGDLQQLQAQRPVRVVATGRDLAAVLSVIDVTGRPTAFRLTDLDAAARRQLAVNLPGAGSDLVDQIERRLGDLVGNPLLFLMALSVSRDGVPATRGDVYDQFIRGLVTRSGAVAPDLPLAALGAAWAELIGRGRRADDHYTWRSSLAAAMNRIEAMPVWRGHECDAGTALAVAQTVGLLVRLDPDGGLAPLHDSFADYLAARAMSRGEAELPATFVRAFDESVLFMVDIAGTSATLEARLARENPLVACRVAKLHRASGIADPVQVGVLLDAFTAGCDLPLLGASRGVRILHHARFTGAILVDDGRELVDEAAFDAFAADRPAVMVPPDTGSLQLAVRLWSTAVQQAHRPAERVYQPVPPLNAASAVDLLMDHAQKVEAEAIRLINTTLPVAIRDRVFTTLGPRGLYARIDEPTPGLLGNMELPVNYRRTVGYDVARTVERVPDDLTAYAATTVERLMRRHPTNQAAEEIREALNALTNRTWPSS